MIPQRPDDAGPFPGPRLTGLALAYLVVQFLCWVPGYLTWPYWPDHDVFAAAAQSWDAGDRPYRDFRINQTPGTIYLFYLLGKVVGWGQPAWFFGFDAALVGTLLVGLLAWSRLRFGRLGPGVFGCLFLTGTLFHQDYTRAGQRDEQAPTLAVLALLILQAAPRSRVGFVASAALAAFAVSIRPQIILLMPALVGSAGGLDPGLTIRASVRRGAAWLACLIGFGALLFLPLVLAGVLGDFVASLRLVAPGASYNQSGWANSYKRWMEQADAVRWWWLAAVVLAILARDRPAADRRLAGVWILALVGVSLYRPLSPFDHFYLVIPLPVVGAGALALAIAWAGDLRFGPLGLRQVAVLGLAVFTIPALRPDFVNIRPTIRLLSAWLRPAGPGDRGPSALDPGRIPLGYRPNKFKFVAPYPWASYAGMLNYLRDETAPGTRVANLLKGDPAVVGMVGRVSALPAEAITWLRINGGTDEAAFARRLEAQADSVVVWIPGEADQAADSPDHIAELEAVVRRRYRFAARFGPIEVWRRVTDSP